MGKIIKAHQIFFVLSCVSQAPLQLSWIQRPVWLEQTQLRVSISPSSLSSPAVETLESTLSGQQGWKWEKAFIALRHWHFRVSYYHNINYLILINICIIETEKDMGNKKYIYVRPGAKKWRDEYINWGLWKNWGQNQRNQNLSWSPWCKDDFCLSNW